SMPVAKYIYETAAKAGKRVQALGGAKNHAVVLPDADLEFAADALIGAAYGSAGERCMAISAVVAVGAAGDPLVKLLEKKAKQIKLGVDMGTPLPERSAGRHGRHQRADPGAGGVLLVRRLEELALRRPARARHRGGQVLYQDQGGDDALAAPGHAGAGLRHADAGVTMPAFV